MNRTHRLAARRLLVFAFITAAMIGASHGGPRTVPFGRTAPCAACGHATPITVECDGITWNVYNPGTVADVAASVCPAGTTYTWKALS